MGIPSMAVSLDNFDQSSDMSLAADVAYSVASRLCDLGLPAGTLLNINVPHIPRSDFKGLRVTRQGRSVWKDTYDVRKDPQGQPYYWLTGDFVTLEPLADADDLAVAEGWAAITPLQYEQTNVDEFVRLKSLNIEL